MAMAVLLLAGGSGQAAEPAEIAGNVCAACHGADGNSQVPTFPRLAGQDPVYLAKQLADFKSGKRKSDVMVPILAGVAEEDFKGLAGWFAGQKPTKPGAQDPQAAEKGKAVFDDGNTESGVPACGGCHQQDGSGNAQFPRIASQHAAYTLAQLVAFKTGARSNDKGKVMRAVAARMTEAEMAAVAEYLAGL